MGTLLNTKSRWAQTAVTLCPRQGRAWGVGIGV